jgi:hypothetical protein
MYNHGRRTEEMHLGTLQGSELSGQCSFVHLHSRLRVPVGG